MEQTGQNSNRAEAKKMIITSKEAKIKGIHSKSPPPKPTKCPFCGKTLYFEGVIFGNSVLVWRTSEPEQCDCEQAQKARKEAANRKLIEAQEKEKQKLIDKRKSLINSSGIRKRYFHCSFKNYELNKENKKAFCNVLNYAKNFDKYSTEGKGLYIEGPNGTGKSHLAAALSLFLIDRNIKVIFKTTNELFCDIKKAYDQMNNIDENDILMKYQTVPLLVIDDLGKEQVTEWTVKVLFSILDARYAEMLPTVITTNYNEQALIKRLTPNNGDSETIKAIISRFREISECITIVCEDYRSRNINK